MPLDKLAFACAEAQANASEGGTAPRWRPAGLLAPVGGEDVAHDVGGVLVAFVAPTGGEVLPQAEPPFPVHVMLTGRVSQRFHDLVVALPALRCRHCCHWVPFGVVASRSRQVRPA